MYFSNGISDLKVGETPIAILDFETTGTRPGRDRVIEVSVLRVEPDGSSSLLIDTLIDPGRPVSATEIHGITDDDVKGAPRFSEIAGELLNAMAGCALAAYNVYFDLRFLEDELERMGVYIKAPHFCLMYMRPMLGLGKRCTLQDACRDFGITPSSAHATAADVNASAALLAVYRKAMVDRRVRTFGELGKLHSYKFVESFTNPALRKGMIDVSKAPVFKSRSTSSPDPRQSARREYWEVLKTTLADLKISEDELTYAIHKREALELEPGELRMLHARAFANVIMQFIEDRELDDSESRKLRRLNDCLRRLGWAPGD